MSRASEILQFYGQLSLKEIRLPENVQVMNPYEHADGEVQKVIHSFYGKYYNDTLKRGLILGINPRRFGAGITGIPFTDSFRLQEYCNINFPLDTRETSSQFIYDVIAAYGGARRFYSDWFIGAVSPLGFIHKNKKGNWVNWNYYDQPELEEAVRPFIIEKLQQQRDICGRPDKCVILGTGKNYKYMYRLNQQIKLFEDVIPLEHPRYIMQYKLKAKDEYINKFLNVLST